MRTLLRLMMMACCCAAFASVGLAQDRKCPANAHPDGEDQKHFYCKCNAGFQLKDGACVAAPKPAPDPAVTFCQTKLRIGADQAALRALDFKGDVEQFEMFGSVAEEQKRALVAAAIDQTLVGIGEVAKDLKSLTPWDTGAVARSLKNKGSRSVTRLLSEGEITRAVDTLVSRGLKQGPMLTAMRKLAKVNGKPEMVEVYEVLEKGAKASMEGYVAGRDMREDPDTLFRAERLTLGLLKVAQNNPSLGLWVTGTEGAIAGAFYLYLKPQVDGLDALTEEELRRAGEIARRLQKVDMPALLAARAAWRKTHGGKGEPSCPR